MKWRALFLSAILALPLSSLGCADSDSDADDSDLSSASVKVLGGFTQSGPFTLPASYTSTPRYRGYSFTAAKGDVVHFRVKQTDGGDAIAYLLNAQFGTVARNDNENASTKDSYLKATIATPGTYYVAFREKRYRASKFSVTFSVDEALPTCEGTPKFPTSGALTTGISGTQYNYVRTCAPGETPPPGGCPWKLEQRVSARAFDINGVARVSSMREVQFDFGLKRYTVFDASSRYNCEITDSGRVTLDANGQGKTTATYEDACNGGPANRKSREVRVSLGSTCLAVTDAEGLEDGRMQIYIAQLN
ncbi:MAG: hypothetical protein U0174_15890 [Polyangiaceae bacterium]